MTTKPSTPPFPTSRPVGRMTLERLAREAFDAGYRIEARLVPSVTARYAQAFLARPPRGTWTEGHTGRSL